jgi:hypothetical protein
MRMFQRSWHGIDLTRLPAAKLVKDKPAGVEFSTQFYQLLASGEGCIEPSDLESRRRLGETIEQGIILPWQKQNGHPPKILALAVGKAPIEQVWCEHGHDLTFNECQEDSLTELRRKFPRARFLVGDIFQIVSDTKYDLITAITVDYVMDRRELTEFLARVTGWLQPGGQIIVYCSSTLSIRQIIREIIKHLLGYYGRKPHVFWGYWRTLGEFCDIAKRTGLKVRRLTNDAAGRVQLKSVPKIFSAIPALSNSNLVLTLEPKDGAALRYAAPAPV